MNNILIIGATSAIAKATARRWACEGHALCLVGRDMDHLREIADDLRVRGAQSVECAALDVNDLARHAEVIDAAIGALGRLDVALIGHGTLGDQKACEQDVQIALQELNTNAISVISLLTHLANRFEAQQHGSIVVLGSVAGDRGRQSNYVYGTAKGAVATFLQGMRNRLHKSGVQVLTVKPGFVDTPMTAAFDKKGPLWSSPDVIAQGILRGIAKRRDVVYAPWYWWGVMLVIRSIPERIFKKLSL
ncbi:MULTISPECIES: SDR family oxidoreductase [Hydrogenophaga]|uniref:Short-chain dehydrogenase/reductase SDR n=1 Tax=Hydrogenophaga intermedia TaxID=65786 RepID=A0A1L1PY36_HYDIT|nr:MULTISPECIES: SDR family oxidoreductase [Hydrogenophaga]AOS81070.1 short-chain dehydrogenase [Hydrogenophaga sp. PBC]TMU71427.1 SDR family oxidoreductase [Hydrogenophaga intermedia]CDN90235.1 Short-chain dehydrogenase/reductase SDR [Hydrogenophaga intermedia]